MDYRRLMGVECLAAASGNGKGVTIAVLDSGVPVPFGFPDCHAWGPQDDIDDYFGHATAIASIFFGGNGIKGLCRAVEPFYIKVLDDSGVGTVKSVSEGIYFAIDHKVDLINLSLGFMRTEKCPKELEKACEAAFEAKIPVFCAAGNDGGPVNWPAALKSTICVGSAAENGLKTAFSSVGEVDFVAPGLDLRVLDTTGTPKKVSGTSFSTALVTGVAALLLPELKKEGGYDVESVKDALRRMSKDVGHPGWDDMTGYGLLAGKIGKNHDSTVGMKIEPRFFDRILNKLKSIFGFTKKEHRNGRV